MIITTMMPIAFLKRNRQGYVGLCLKPLNADKDLAKDGAQTRSIHKRFSIKVNIHLLAEPFQEGNSERLLLVVM